MIVRPYFIVRQFKFFFARARARAYETTQKLSEITANFYRLSKDHQFLCKFPALIGVIVLAIVFSGQHNSLAKELDADTQARVKAAKDLAVQKGSSAKPQLMAQLQTETSPHVRASIIDALAATCRKDCLGTFKAALGDSEPLVRLQAVQAIGSLGGPEAGRLLRDVVTNDTNEGVRISAAFWLGGLRDADSVAALGKALKGDNDPHVRAQAAHALKWIGTSSARNALKQASQDKDARVQKIANEP